MKILGEIILVSIIVTLAALALANQDNETVKGITGLVLGLVMIGGIAVWAQALVASPGSKAWGRRIRNGWRRILHS